MSEATYWYLNTNERGVPNDGRIAVWFNRGLGFTFGEEFGPPLAKLNSGDFVFLYRSGAGIIAIGTVFEAWNHRTYQGKARILDYSNDIEEFQIRIDWFADFRDGPLNGNDVIGNTPSQFLESIADLTLRSRAIELVANWSLPNPDPSRIYFEGGRRSSRSIRRVHRSSRLARDKIASVPIEELACECCGQRTQDIYPANVLVYEVHHSEPFEDNDEPRETTLEDVEIVCPNCHTAITKMKTTVAKLRLLLGG